MWELNYKESWALKNWYFWTVVLHKGSWDPLDYKEIQPVHSKGDQSWVYILTTDVEAETPIHWSPDAMNWLVWKDPDAGEGVEKREPSYTGGGNANYYSHYGEQCGDSLKNWK